MLSIGSSFQTTRYQLIPPQTGASTSKDASSAASPEKSDHSTTSNSTANKQLSPEQTQEVAKLKARDREVKAHEQAHLSAAGGIATSGPTFTYQLGPDGIRYAIGGEVNIDTSPVAGDPQATIRKAETIQKAANAPASPSDQDRKVAAAAAQMAAKAQTELLQKNQSKHVSNYHAPKVQIGSNINYSV
jgi:hypothetical protein